MSAAAKNEWQKGQTDVDKTPERFIHENSKNTVMLNNILCVPEK
jgi:hypothetical protein